MSGAHDDLSRCVLGQKFSEIPEELAAVPASLEVLKYGEKEQPFLARLGKGKNKKYVVGVVGELYMHNKDTLEHARMIIGPDTVIDVKHADIISIQADLVAPEGFRFEKKARGGDKELRYFNFTKIMEEFMERKADGQ